MDADPDSLTVSQIKALLSEAGVDLPATKHTRQFYVDLFLEHQKSHQETPKKRKSRHSINVFQSGSKKPLIDEEEKEHSIKKRKSLAPSDTKQQSPPQTPQPPQQIQPQIQHQPQSLHHQPQLQPLPQLQPAPLQQLPTPLRGLQPLQTPPLPSQSQPSSFASSSHTKTQSHKYQLPPTLFKPLPQTQNPTHGPLANKQSNYISPLYLPSYSREVPTVPPNVVPQQQTPVHKVTSNRDNGPLSPSQYPLPPPPSPMPIRAQPPSPLPPPPPPLSQNHPKHLTKEKSSGLQPKRDASDLLHYIYTILVVVLWMAALVGLYTLVAQYFASSFQFCDADTEYGSCIRCPEHGICEGGVLRCAPKYVRSGMKCVDDIEFSLLAESMGERMYSMLMEAGGKHQCGHAAHNYLSIDELKDSLSNAGLCAPEKFNSAFNEGLQILTDPARYDVGVIEGNKLYSKTISLSLLCMAKLAFYGQLPYLALIVSIIVVGFTVRFWRIQKQKEAIEVSNIAATVLQDLQTRKENANGGEAGVVIEHERDTHLQGMRERKKAEMWKRVQAVVQADSRVSEYASWKNGAQVTSWEWVG